MPDPSEPSPSITPDIDKILEEADRLAAETVAEAEAGALPTLDEITPEMLENMDPAQLQAIIREMQGNQKERPPQSHFTRKQHSKAYKKAKRKRQKVARAITRNTGGGRTTPLRTRGASRGG